LICNNGAIEISIADNGRGFDIETKTATAQYETGEHLGLSGMCHRMRSIGGECHITSSPGGGTLIRFVFPLLKTNGQ
jgi:signal transduction histidine kinase